MYNIQFVHRQKSYTMQVSEVALAQGAVSYAVRLLHYKGLFINKCDDWKLISQTITSEGLKKLIIDQIQLHCRILRLLDRSVINTSALI